MDQKVLVKYLDAQKVKAVEIYDFESKKVKYSEKIKGWNIEKYRGEEEKVRSYLLAHLTNDLGYKLESLEIEKEYSIGRPKVNKPRIDLILRDANQNAFLYIEIKSPEEFENNKDETIEKQLFALAAQEVGQGRSVQYLVLYTYELISDDIRDKAIIIDYNKFSSFEAWKKSRDFADTIPFNFGKAQKIPFTKGGKKDLEKDFSKKYIESLQRNLHNVLWGGGGTDDNTIFSSLVNVILAKIQDESEKKSGDTYDFQLFKSRDGESFESCALRII